jgi:hypothetical protein
MLGFVATSWFIVAPWLSEPVLWWSASCLTISTACMLTAAHFFINGISTPSTRSLLWIFLACLGAFLALCFYDMWIPGFLLFFGIWVLLSFDSRLPLSDLFRRRTSVYAGAMAIPFVLWCGLVIFIGPRSGQELRLNLSPYQIPITLASLHLRIANWFISAAGGHSPDWLASWKLGIAAFASPTVLLLFISGFVLLVLISVFFAAKAGKDDEAVKSILRTSVQSCQNDLKFSADRAERRRSFEIFPLRTLFFAWMFFLASRLAIVLQGGTALSGRFNYGAGMAMALAAATLAGWAWHRWCKHSFGLRWLSTIGFIVSVGLMALATVGHAQHIALSSQAEAYTIRTLTQELAKRPEIRSILVVGTPVPDTAAPDAVLNYFSEGDGYWLSYILQKHFGPNLQAQVLRIDILRHKYPSADAVFVWSGKWPRARLIRSPL